MTCFRQFRHTRLRRETRRITSHLLGVELVGVEPGIGEEFETSLRYMATLYGDSYDRGYR